MMDVDLYYAGNCDISFTVAGMSGGIRDLQIGGLLRMIMRPIVPYLPFIGVVEISLLGSPSIDFELTGAVDFLNVPGLKDLLRRIIVKQVIAAWALPEKISIDLTQFVPRPVVEWDGKMIQRVTEEAEYKPRANGRTRRIVTLFGVAEVIDDSEYEDTTEADLWWIF